MYAILRGQYNPENTELKERWARKKGFERGITDNILDALDERYYCALKHQCFGYRRVLPRAYFVHLETHWCKLDTATRKRMKADYLTPWGERDDTRSASA